MEVKSPAENILDSNSIGVDLQITDARVALTFLDLAETTNIAEDKSRRIAEALKAHTSILHFLARLNPTAEQSLVLKDLMGALEARLTAAGAIIG